jgi:hypothetical protein
VPSGQIIPVGIFQEYPGNLTWVTYDGLCFVSLRYEQNIELSFLVSGGTWLYSELCM